MRVKALAHRILSQIRHDKRTLGMILIAPLLILTVIYYIFNSSDNTFTVGVVAIIVNGSIPIWFAVAVLAREVLVGVSVAVATLAFGMQRFDVTWWGKTATFLLMFAVPGFLMAESSIGIAASRS